MRFARLYNRAKREKEGTKYDNDRIKCVKKIVILKTAIKREQKPLADYAEREPFGAKRKNEAIDV